MAKFNFVFSEFSFFECFMSITLQKFSPFRMRTNSGKKRSIFLEEHLQAQTSNSNKFRKGVKFLKSIRKFSITKIKIFYSTRKKFPRQ